MLISKSEKHQNLITRAEKSRKIYCTRRSQARLADILNDSAESVGSESEDDVTPDYLNALLEKARENARRAQNQSNIVDAEGHEVEEAVIRFDSEEALG